MVTPLIHRLTLLLLHFYTMPILKLSVPILIFLEEKRKNIMIPAFDFWLILCSIYKFIHFSSYHLRMFAKSNCTTVIFLQWVILRGILPSLARCQRFITIKEQRKTLALLRRIRHPRRQIQSTTAGISPPQNGPCHGLKD